MNELEIFDPDVIIATLLHDIYETSEGISRETIEFNFGTYVSFLIEAMHDDRDKINRKIPEELHNAKVKIPGEDFLIIRMAENLDHFRSFTFDPRHKPIDFINKANKYYFPLAEQTNNHKLKYLISELKKERNKIVD